MNLLANLSLHQLRRAVAIKEQISSLETELQEIVGVSSSAPSIAKRRGKRRTMSASARARIGAAQKAIWAKRRTGRAESPAKKVRRKISAKGRAKLAALAKARWAKAKASGKMSLGA